MFYLITELLQYKVSWHFHIYDYAEIDDSHSGMRVKYCVR